MKSGAPSTGGDESGAADELYHRQPAGPTLTAMLMQNFSDNLLFIMIASVSFIYLLTLLRKAGHHPTPVAHA
ncbi:hypothetical protein IUJ34_03775 [Klebsiella pneumoniae subsp. pneumoniae]|uniref:Uncharacterized protein n=1 Tax=Klebsiella pneumoniae subsp. pneumoniae TaxID=72407 RepID=A0A7S9HF69_KLEPN|nr:hypothetical protein IUJ34_03775 [Klebsiella pneumoniae subsp. pneumoniae]